MRRTERAAYRTKFYSNLSSPTQFDEEPFFVGTNMTTTKKPGEHMIVRLVFNY